MHTEATPFEALQAAVAQAGSQSALARVCGVSQTAVWKWIQRGKRLPAELCLVVERETGVSKHLLRPDIYPSNPTPGVVPNPTRKVACDRTGISHRIARA
jgi:DNA-binding transcriptional regulator YdaS (Cro superfamily)